MQQHGPRLPAHPTCSAPNSIPGTRRGTGPRFTAQQGLSSRSPIGLESALLTPYGTLSSSANLAQCPRARQACNAPLLERAWRCDRRCLPRCAATVQNQLDDSMGFLLDPGARAYTPPTAVLRVASASACVGCGSLPAQRNTLRPLPSIPRALNALLDTRALRTAAPYDGRAARALVDRITPHHRHSLGLVAAVFVGGFGKWVRNRMSGKKGERKMKEGE
ncbi:hypothetical protein DFH09DRAFT_1421077 [Mycena vulgaris]|nr:hypothetical protein DFH09DRAFT_1421077 [Mycena vulgaris]